MNIFAGMALVNVVTSTVLGFLVLFANTRATTNRAFAAFAGVTAFWSYAYFNWQIATDSSSALLWVHLLMASAIFITPVYFHFITYFLGLTKQYRRIIIGGYIFIGIFSIVNWTPLYVAGVKSIAGLAFWPIAGPLFLPFLSIWIFYAVYPIFLLGQRLRTAVGDELAAIRYILAGTIIGYVGGCTNYFLWFGIPVLPYGNFSASIYIALIAFVMMRHHILQVKVIATELLIFTMWLILFVRVLFANTTQDQIIETVVLMLMVFVGSFLIRSVGKEVTQRELIEQQEHELEAVNKQQENLLHFISHEIKGYLTKSEAGFSAIAEGDFGVVSPELKDMAGNALTEVRKGVRTVMDILDASNLKRGTVSYKKKEFDLRDVVTYVVDHLKSAIEEKHLTVEMHIAWELPCKVSGDEEKIRDHVIRNLIDNAIKYTPQGSFKVSVARKGTVVQFSVQDSGVGITPEDMRRLFTEGGHGKDSIKVNVHSTGYGLYIAKTIIDAHGGKIWAESDGAGKGSRFVVELPTIG